MDWPKLQSAATLLCFTAVCLGNGNDPKWQVFDVRKAELSFSMPATPVGSQADLNGQRSFFYTCDAPQGRFVAGYTPIAASFQQTMKRGIAADPGSTGIMRLLDSTIASFAQGGKAKISGVNFGMDHGLPAEFATLKNAHATLKVRVYLCSKRLYIFVAGTDSDSASRFFDSIKIPAEIKKT
jgi:hypothetical protein